MWPNVIFPKRKLVHLLASTDVCWMSTNIKYCMWAQLRFSQCFSTMRKMLVACTGADFYEGGMKPLYTDDENTMLVMWRLSCILPFHPEPPLQNKGIIYANEWKCSCFLCRKRRFMSRYLLNIHKYLKHYKSLKTFAQYCMHIDLLWK